jgi:hypothetical protein
MKIVPHIVILLMLTSTQLWSVNKFHIINNTPFTAIVTAHILGTDKNVTRKPILPTREGTMNIADYRIDTILLRIVDDKGQDMIVKTMRTAYDYPQDMEINAQIINPEQLLASPEPAQVAFAITVTQKRGTGNYRSSEQVIPLSSTFTLNKPENLLVINSTPYIAQLTTITDLRGIITKTHLIKAYAEEVMSYSKTNYPLQGFNVQLFAQNTQSPCLNVNVGKLNPKGNIGINGLRPNVFIIVKEGDGSITAHEAITTPQNPKQRVDILREWISKDFPISSGAYKRTAAVCEKP